MVLQFVCPAVVCICSAVLYPSVLFVKSSLKLLLRNQLDNFFKMCFFFLLAKHEDINAIKNKKHDFAELLLIINKEQAMKCIQIKLLIMSNEDLERVFGISL